MPRWTTEKIFGVFPNDAEEMGLAVDVGTGTVVLSVLTNAANDTYVTHKTYIADEVDMVSVAGLQIKVTPTGDAEFWFAETQNVR